MSTALDKMKRLRAAIEGERRNQTGVHVTKTDKLFVEIIA